MNSENHEREEVREERIEMEIIVDTYDGYEAAAGWYAYLENHINFPFKAEYSSKKTVVNVVGMADSDDCSSSMFAFIDLGDGIDLLLARLEDLSPLQLDEKSNEAIDDWKYWIKMGYGFY